MPKTPPGARASSSPRTSCDQPITKIASGRSARTASIVSGALTSEVSTSGAPTSSKERCPERFGSIGPGSVTTPTISAPASAAATRQSWPIVSKLIQTARTGADSTEGPSNREPGAAPRGRALKLPCNSLLQSLVRRNAAPDALLTSPCNSLLQGLVGWPLVSGANGHRGPGLALGELPCAKSQRAGDESPDDDPRRLRHASDLHAGEDERRGERGPERSVGEPDAELASDQHTGDRPDEEPRHRVEVDRAEREVAESGDPEQRGGVEDVGPHDPARRERVDEQHHEPEERPATDRREADDKAAEEAEPEGDRLVPAGEDGKLLSSIRPRAQERLRKESRPAQEERHSDGLRLDRLRAVAIVVREDGRNADPGERHRPGAREHPQRKACVDGAELPVPDRAEGLEDRAVEDVCPDGVGRLEAEEDDQDRRHQRPAAHSCQADEDTDQQAGERELPGHDG